jgi:hypothetical protein
MAADSENYHEWLEDFGASRADDAELQKLLERVRATGDADLRRAIKELQLWRWLGPYMLDRIVPVGAPVDETDQVLKLARFLVRGEGAIGAA